MMAKTRKHSSKPASSPVAHKSEVWRGAGNPTVKLVARFQSHLGCDDKLAAQLLAMTGCQSPMASTRMVSAIAMREGKRAWNSGILQMARVLDATELRFMQFDQPFNSGDAFAVDLKAVRKALNPTLRQHLSHFAAMMKPVRSETGISLSTFVVGVKRGEGDSGGGPGTVRSIAPLVAVEDRIIPASKKSVADVSEYIWSFASGGVLDLNKSSTPSKLGRDDALPELDTLCARALFPIDRSLFGQGIGKRLVQSMGRILRAHASAMDLGNTAPLKPEGLEAFLAGLRIDRAANRVSLPVIRVL
jgi:hypothetical protein